MKKLQGTAQGFFRWLADPRVLSFVLLGVFVLLSFALAGDPGSETTTEIEGRINIILCPILDLLTGTVAKIIGVLFLAWAVIQYMTNDSRGAKATAIAAVFGIILILTFPTWQKLITQMDYVSNPANRQQVTLPSGQRVPFCLTKPN
jgi:type IV secretory pathway VirB2 component (pilin)